MKLIAGSILILLVMVQSLTSWVVMAEYIMNKEYIAKNLCVNKERPKLHCNGKCQLMKKMTQQENQDSSSNPQGGKMKMDVLFAQKSDLPSIRGLGNENINFNSAYIVEQLPGAVQSIFHPPATT